AMTGAEGSGNRGLGMGAPIGVDGAGRCSPDWAVAKGSSGSVLLADGTSPVTNGMTLTSAELTGLVFRPVADANGAAGSFSYSVNDGSGGSDSQTVTLNVTPVNDAPAADADKTGTVAEDSGNSTLRI